MCKTQYPCGCISMCTTDILRGLATRDHKRLCPIFLDICQRIELAKIIGQKMDEFNVYIDMEENLIDREAYLEALRGKEREFLIANDMMRNLLVNLDSASWNALVSRDGFCRLFESIFGWHPAEISERRPKCQEKHS